MIGDMFNNNNSRKVCTRIGQRMYHGRKYAVEKATGYLVCTSGERKRLHVVMYETEHNVEIPDGFVVHHIDFDKTHNEIDNLCCITVAEHEMIHNHKKGQEIEPVIDIFTGRVIQY